MATQFREVLTQLAYIAAQKGWSAASGQLETTRNAMQVANLDTGLEVEVETIPAQTSFTLEEA